MKLNERIKAWRVHVGMKVSTMAARVGVAWESAYQWETGKTTPRTEHLSAVVDALGLSMAQFWGPVPAAPTTRRKRKAA